MDSLEYFIIIYLLSKCEMREYILYYVTIIYFFMDDDCLLPCYIVLLIHYLFNKKIKYIITSYHSNL